MTWLIGLVNEGELELLRGRGWEVTEPPAEAAEALFGTREEDSLYRLVSCYVDNDLFNIMSGPDWSTEPDYVHSVDEVEDYRKAIAEERAGELVLALEDTDKEDLLDVFIHSLVTDGHEAADINNGGYDRQVEYLIDKFDYPTAKRIVNNFVRKAKVSS